MIHVHTQKDVSVVQKQTQIVRYILCCTHLCFNLSLSGQANLVQGHVMMWLLQNLFGS